MRVTRVCTGWLVFGTDICFWNKLYQHKLLQLMGTLGESVARKTQQEVVDCLTTAALAHPFVMKVLLTTHPMFTRASCFFIHLLLRCCNGASAAIRMRVCNVLRHWLQQFPSDFDLPMIELVQLFAQTRLRCAGHHTLYHILVRSLKRADIVRTTHIIHIESRDLCAPFALLDESLWAQWLACDEKQLAEQLTLRDANVLAQIPRSELLNRYCWTQPELSPHVTAMMEQFNALRCGLLRRVQQLTSPKCTVPKIVQVAIHLRALNNFHSLNALVSILQNPMLSPFIDSLPQRIRSEFYQLLKLTDSSNNYRVYRAVLSQLAPPAVPYLGLVLQDLAAIEDYTPSNRVISLRKCSLIHKAILPVCSSQTMQYDVAAEPALLQLFDALFLCKRCS